MFSDQFYCSPNEGSPNRLLKKAFYKSFAFFSKGAKKWEKIDKAGDKSVKILGDGLLFEL